MMVPTQVTDAASALKLVTMLVDAAVALDQDPHAWLEHFVDRGVIIGAHSAAQRRSRARFSEKNVFSKKRVSARR